MVAVGGHSAQARGATKLCLRSTITEDHDSVRSAPAAETIGDEYTVHRNYLERVVVKREVRTPPDTAAFPWTTSPILTLRQESTSWDIL